MSKVVERPATYEDLLEVPDHLVAEIVEGELFTSPRPASRHALATTRLGSDLDQRFGRDDGGAGGWWIVIEPELHLGRDILVPDIAGWRRERMPSFPDVTFFELAPDWICEVVSPFTARLDRIRKLPRYARYDIAYAWIVDPKEKTLEVYRREGAHMLLFSTHEGSTLIRAEPFDAAGLNLGALWIEP
ncbi:MAG TPA: Uma2 family endonuclease [Thermoanaerobaculia bacterium]|nr:Uma2 family endonuclease [Thermoanaerobaculia bacterium]